ncbi:MAG: ribonuclease HII [Proteobacteria bacterium]|nr:ribonuclease HII [Pseudomonadota bacterium]
MRSDVQTIIRLHDTIPAAYVDGSQAIAGVDEAGRGPLVGEVVAASVILDPERPIDGLDDSKKLSEKRRNILAEAIKENALSWSVASVSAARIDEINILNATFEAMRAAIGELGTVYSWCLVDGNKTPANDSSMVAVIKGDQRIPAISAASILAKVARDAMMYELDKQYPQYGFARHKGYPTKIHIEALRQHGPIDEHRRSYGPVARYLNSG